MLFTLAVILLIAWLLGVVGTYTIGAFVHVLLVIAVVLFIVGLLTRRRLFRYGGRAPWTFSYLSGFWFSRWQSAYSPRGRC